MHTQVDLLFIMAAHNRRALTERAILKAAESAAHAGLSYKTFLFDDGCTDGTSEAVRRLGLPVEIIEGDGTAFWARGMSLAEDAALSRCPLFSFLIWLNDDVDLDVDFVERAVSASREFPGSVLACPVRSSLDGETSYGGLVRSGRHPLSFTLVPRADMPQIADTFNGNVLFIPRSAHDVIGRIDGAYAHGLADIDYGIRARRAGVGIVVPGGTFGICERNTVPWFQTRRAAWRNYTGVRGGGRPQSVARILRLTSPATWPIWMTSSYALWWLRRVFRAGPYSPY